MAVLIVYNVFFFNRYFALSEGWFSAYGHLIRQGKIPYRDFYLYVTPLYPLLISGFTSLFGEDIIGLRILGIGVICSIAILLYRILIHRFTALPSFVAAVTAVVYYQSGSAHITYDFIQFVTLFALAAALCLAHLARMFQREKFNARSAHLYSVLVGCFASLAFLTKQSNGALILVAVFVALVLLVSRVERAAALRSILASAVGAAVPAVLCGGWLYVNGALEPFWNQVVTQAVTVKGGGATIFFSWLQGIVTDVYAIQFKTVVIYTAPFIIASSLLSWWIPKARFPYLDWWRIDWTTIGAAGVFAAAVLLPYVHPLASDSRAFYGKELYNYIVVIATSLYVFLFLALCVVQILKLHTKATDLMAVGTVGLGMVIGNGTSAGIGEVSTFLGFAIAIAWFMSLPRIGGVPTIGTAALCASLALWFAGNKYQRPYAWWSLTQPAIWLATSPAKLPVLAGFRLSASDDYVLSGTVKIFKDFSSTTEDVLAFPDLPILYLASDRWPAGKALVHWFDFISDSAVDEEVRRISRSPPKVIAFLEMPEFVWILHERLFRAGKPLRQRDLRAAILSLTSDQSMYRLQARYDVPDQCVLWIWVRLR